jgi:hypothetical protein
LLPADGAFLLLAMRSCHELGKVAEMLLAPALPEVVVEAVEVLELKVEDDCTLE